MTETKRILVLANSIRNQQRCVAGKEVGRSLFWWKASGWIRLIDPGTKEGEVRIENTYCEGGGRGRVLDIVDVPVTGPAIDPHHPEDWMLKPDTAWKRVERLSFAELGDLADQPEQLWAEEGQTRWVGAGYVAEMEQPASLYLIADPEECVASWWKEPEIGGEKGEKVRRRLSFVYRGQRHECDITDPMFARRHAIFESAKVERQMMELKTPLFLCLSLTRPWQGKQYKIAASIFESHA